MPEKPFRLKRPYPQAKSAISPFEPDDTNFADGTAASNKTVLVPIIAWGAIRIRCQITGAAGSVALSFARPNRATDPASIPAGPTVAFVYTAGQPAADPTPWVDGVELVIDITAAEHVGENWLKIVLDPAAAADIDFFDVSGVNVGQGS